MIAEAFKEAGFEVIYSGLHNTADDIVLAAVQEDVDVIGLSILSGAHNTLVPKIVDGLKDNNMFDRVLLLVGGTIPDSDRDKLKDMGVSAIFGPGSDTNQAIEFINNEFNS